MCEGCGITHLLKDCPIRLQREEKMPLESTKEGSTTVDNKKEESPVISTESSLKTSSKSLPSSPQKRQFLPQSTMSLLKSQVMELQVDNAKIDQAKSTMMQSKAMKEQIPQASSKN